MQDSPQQPVFQIALPASDWQTILAGLYELPMKFAAPVAQRLQEALAAASRPTPIRENPDE